jgi:2-oxoglutarate ferredoxin oxidoreductase subunit delta
VLGRGVTAKEARTPVINREWCKGCGICVAFCPTHALTLDAGDKATLVHPDQCTSCGLCEFRCPDLAIELV